MEPNEQMPGTFPEEGQTPPPFREDEAKRSFARVGFAVSAVILISYLSVYLIQWAVFLFFPQIFETSLFQLASGSLPMYLFGFGAGALILRKMPRELPERRRVKPQMYLILFVMLFGVMYIGNLISTQLIAIIELITGQPYISDLETVVSESPVYLTILFSVILAPIMEELFFRKLLIDRLTPFGDVVAIVVSAVIFGLFHGNFYQVFYAAGLGLILGWIYLYSGNILYSISLHMLFNLAGGVLLPKLVEQLGLGDGELTLDVLIDSIVAHPFAFLGYMAYVLFLYAALITTVTLVIVMRRRIMDPLRAGSTPIPRGKRMSVIFCNVGICILVLLTVGMFALSFL